MIRARQHMPGFVTGTDPAEAQVSSLGQEAVRELLRAGFIQNWARMPDFDHFEYSNHNDADLLMAIMKDGKFWVVAYVTPRNALAVELPQWKLMK